VTSVVASWQATQGTHYADYVSAVISAGLKRFQGDLASDLAKAAAEAHADAILSAAESSADARRTREIAGAGLAWATIVGPAWGAAAAAEAQAAADAIGAIADASQAWAGAIGSAFVGWAMSQAQADADFGIAGAIAGATAGNAAAAAGSMFSAAASKGAADLTLALNAVQTGFVDAATATSLEATKTIAAAETVQRKAVAKADVVLAKDLQAAWSTYAAAECGAVILNARERATIGADYKKDVAGAELAAVKEVAPARKTSSVAAAEANGVYHVKVTGIIADLGILGGQIHVEQVKASQSLISPATLKKWLDSLSSWGDMAAALAKGLAQGVANSINGVQDNFAHTGNLAIAYVNTVADVTDAVVGTPEDQRIRIPMIPLVDWSRGRFTVESDFDHSTSKAAGGFGFGVLGPMGYARLTALRNLSTVDDLAGATKALGAQDQVRSWRDFLPEAEKRLLAAKADYGNSAVMMALSRKQALTRLEGLESAILYHLDDHIPSTIKGAPNAINHWRTEVSGLIADMERLTPHVGKKSAAAWQSRISEMRKRLDDLLGN
jgi:hypothetical protein